MEEPVLISQKSISTSLGLLFLVLFCVTAYYTLQFINYELSYFILVISIVINLYFIIRYLKVPRYSFYNEFFVEEIIFSGKMNRIEYCDLENFNLKTSSFSQVGSNKQGFQFQGSPQNETLRLRLKNGREIIFEEAMYDNFKLIRKLFTELSEKDDTSRLN
jgi:hypothetical protein